MEGGMLVHRGIALGLGIAIARVWFGTLSFLVGLMVLWSIGFFIWGYWILGIVGLLASVGLQRLVWALIRKGGAWRRPS
jgi:hypothetical protein